ncbi:MAG: FAD-dependent oxidoreductase [Polyangiaceae bacterium]
MIFEASRLPLPLHLKADLCVIGSGAGGAMAAMVAAEAGLSVVVLEAGEFLTPADMVQREEVMLPLLYWDSGGRTTKDRAVKIHQGRGVGGSTLHNLNLCKRIPLSIRERWAADRKLDHLPAATWDSLYSEVEKLLEVSQVPRDKWNRHNQILEKGCEALGWAGGGLSHNRSGCIGSGFCEIGCAYDGKNNAAKVLVPRAVKAGAEIVSRCQAVRVRHNNGKVTGVFAQALAPRTNRPIGEVIVDAPRVCVSGSATATPALLLRSGVPDPGGETGNHLHIHPALVAAGDFEDPVRAWEGIPQTYECTQYLHLDDPAGDRVWIVPAFAHPVGTASLVPGHGTSHRDTLKRYSHLAALTAMIHDETRGTVRPDGDLGLSIEYWPNESDRAQLVKGALACAELLFAAGAKAVFLPGYPARRYERGQKIEPFELTPGSMDVTAVHPMGSVPMGDIPSAAVDSQGKHRHLEGLWIADGSLFPTSIGVPPQLSIYAMGLHVGRALAQKG